MAKGSLEERVSAIEAELAQLKKQLVKEELGGVPWWEKIFGSFADSEEYEEAMRLGREYRESLRPQDDAEQTG